MEQNINPEITPELPLAKPRSSSPIIPMLFGVLVVVVVASALAGLYYFSRLKKEVASVNSSPTPTATPAQSTPSPSPSPSQDSSPTPSIVARRSPTPTPIPSTTPTTPSPSNNPPQQNINTDIRFGNPAAHVRQTFDDGSGAGRVINREFSSIQTGEFDEVKTAWNPRVTVCFHVVSNVDIVGDKLSYLITENTKTVSQGTLSQYSKLEAGKIYDVCHDTTTAIGSHKLELSINSTKTISELVYSNNTARIDYKNLPDNIAPNFTIIGPNNEGDEGTCLFPQYISDNVSPISSLKIEQKIDSGPFTAFSGSRYCYLGGTGDSHTYTIRITDERGNKNEQSTNFKLY